MRQEVGDLVSSLVINGGVGGTPGILNLPRCLASFASQKPRMYVTCWPIIRH